MYNYENPLNSADFYFEEVEHLKLKGIGKKVKEKAKKTVKKVGQKIKDVAKKLSPADAIYLPLLPFKLVMLKQLQKKGIKTGKTMPEVAFNFAKHIVKKENLDDEETKTTGEKLQDVAGTVQQVGGVVGSAAGIVKIIISFFKKNDQKVKDGTASADEMDMKLGAEEGLKALDESDEDAIEAAAKGKTKQGTETTTKTGGISNTTLYLLAGVVIVVLLLRKR